MSSQGKSTRSKGKWKDISKSTQEKQIHTQKTPRTLSGCSGIEGACGLILQHTKYPCLPSSLLRHCQEATPALLYQTSPLWHQHSCLRPAGPTATTLVSSSCHLCLKNKYITNPTLLLHYTSFIFPGFPELPKFEHWLNCLKTVLKSGISFKAVLYLFVWKYNPSLQTATWFSISTTLNTWRSLREPHICDVTRNSNRTHNYWTYSMERRFSFCLKWAFPTSLYLVWGWKKSTTGYAQTLSTQSFIPVVNKGQFLIPLLTPFLFQIQNTAL